MMAGRPTIIDVARKAGVSKSTVSLVLRNSPTVRTETARAVRAAMSELGYVYNRGAANLRGAGTGLIGVVINDLRNPFFTEFATSLQMALSARSYAIVLANTDEDPAQQAQVIGAMIEHGVSAFIVSPSYGDGENGLSAIERAGIPTMLVLRRVEDRAGLFPFAAPDYPTGSRLATEHLLAGEPRRIAFVGGPAGSSVQQERMTGYLDVLRGARMEPLVLSGRATRAFGREVVHRLGRDHPEVDAVLCFNDLVALGLLSGCAETGRNVGAGGLRVVGFDDIEEAGQSWPPLSSVSCNIAGFGRFVAETVLRWLDEGARPPPETRSPVTLAVRASSALTA